MLLKFKIEKLTFFASSVCIFFSAAEKIDITDSEKKVLGYDPEIEIVYETHKNAYVDPEQVTVVFHGWKQNKESFKLRKEHKFCLPGTIIIGNAPDARQDNVGYKKRSSFGQMSDVRFALVMLKKAALHDDVTKIDLWGYSKGGALALITLAVLLDNTDKYKKEFDKIGISEQDKQKIIEKIQQGTIVLSCPLLDFHSAFEKRIKKYLPKWSHSYKRCINGIVTALEYVLPIFTRYKPWKECPIKMVREIHDWSGRVLIHFEPGDEALSNKYIPELYDIFCNNGTNNENVYLVVGTDYVHQHSFKLLSRVLSTLNKKIGSSYYKNLCDKQLICDMHPSVNMVEAIIVKNDI